MLELILSVGEKVLILFLMIAVGAVVCRKKILTKEGASQLAEVVLLIATPCVIVSAFSADSSGISVGKMLFVTALAVVIHFLAIGVSKLFFRGEPEARRKVLRFAVIYANVGFMGLPLIQSILGADGVIYVSIFIAVFNIFCWTHGVRLMERSKDPSADGENTPPPWWKCLLNPGTIGLFAGLLVFFFKPPIPDFLTSVIDSFSALNTPLAMICIGIHISTISPKHAVRDKSMLLGVALRLLLLPIIVLGLLCLTTRDYPIFVTCLLLSAMPTAANCVLFSIRYHGDETLASQAVAVATLLSILTLPLFSALAKLICG